MEILLVKIASALALPPGLNLALCVIGIAIRRRLRTLGVLVFALGFVSLYLLATPAVATRLVAGLEQVEPIRDPATLAARADAIVLLGGGRNPSAPEYGGDTVSASSLVRVRYAAWLQRASQLPLLATGGRVLDGGTPEADLMSGVLVNELGVPVQWVERASRNTAENAIDSQILLARAGVRRIALVTSAMHMKRAKEMFERVGLEVIPAPTDFQRGYGARGTALEWLPSANALGLAAAALHEQIGRIWYRLRY